MGKTIIPIEVRKALETIKKYCDNNEECETCPLCNVTCDMNESNICDLFPYNFKFEVLGEINEKN